MYMKDSLKLETAVLHGNDSPLLSEVLAKLCLITVARILPNLFLDSVLQFDHVSLKHLLIRLLQWNSFLHSYSNMTEAIRLFSDFRAH